LAFEFYLKLRALGWEETLRWWKGGSTSAKKSDVTVGEYIDAVAEKSLIHSKTIESCGAALRKIAGDIHDVTHDGLRSTWRVRVDGIKLATLAAEMIEAWRANFIKAGSVNPVKERSARVSANSFIGRARSLFGADVIARVKDIVEIPSPIPFAGVKVEKVRVPRYRSGFDMATLLESARQELATAKPEEFKIFLLAAMAGLRRNEIDKLPWAAFRWNEGLIRIEATEFFRPKSHESAGDVVVDPELIEIFRGYHARAESNFVIESENEPDNGKPFEHYRCEREFAELIGWLRAKGVVSRTPLHSLRKEFGSQINARYALKSRFTLAEIHTPREVAPRIWSSFAHTCGVIETLRTSTVLPPPDPRGLPAPGLAPPLGIRGELTLAGAQPASLERLSDPCGGFR